MSQRADFQAVWRCMRADAGREFLRMPSGPVKYGQLTELVSRFCSDFHGRGLGQTDRIVIVSRNEAVAGAAFLAALLDGLVPVMLSADSKPDRISAICSSVEPGLIITDPMLMDQPGGPGQGNIGQIMIPTSFELPPLNRGLGSAWQGLVRHFRADTPEVELELPSQGREPRLPPADDTLAYILFTSGTTRSPSGVMITRNSLMAQLETLTRLFSYDADSRIFNATPLAHTDGLVQGLLLAAANGATLLRPGPFSLPGLEEWLDNLGRFGATHFITNPTVLALIDRFAGHDDYFDDEGFFGILSSASILRPELWQKIESRFACSLYNLYGMTETVANATYAGRHPEMGPVGSIGFPVDCEVRLIDQNSSGLEQESGLQGELQVRGENVFQGYWNNPARTVRTLMDGNWMRTGDLARRRSNGGLEIIGRISTVINMGGQSVMPEEVDEVLAAHPAVLDVATVGLSDPEFEEVAISAVVLERPVSEAALTEHCRQRLEQLKVPKRIIALEEIPRGGAGKPKIGLLRDLLAPLLSGSGDVSQGEDDIPVSAESVFELAAQVFRVSADGLDASSSPATVEGWDSFNQMNLMIEAELKFGIRIPASQVAGIRTLGDLHRTIIANR